MLIIVALSCFFDAVIFTIDGIPGIFFRLANILGNTITYFTTIAICLLWNFFIIFHLYGDNKKTRKKVRLLFIPAIIMYILVSINMFIPIIFTIDSDNVYRRTLFAYPYSFIALAYIINSIYIHMTFKDKKSVNFFPIWVFVIPILIGYFAQTFFYGIATGWVSVSVGLCSAFMSIQKESAYVDSLTGLLNRAYLFSSNLYDTMSGGMMIDINQFKRINDTYGHSAGDKALKEVASILFKSTNGNGAAIRYAGDEFLIFISKDSNDTLLEIKNHIINELDKLNSLPDRQYHLALSFGLGEYDATKENFDEFLYRLDTNMYLDKEQYYLNHKEFSRRKA